jgi:hypothetical protein
MVGNQLLKAKSASVIAALSSRHVCCISAHASSVAANNTADKKDLRSSAHKRNTVQWIGHGVISCRFRGSDGLTRNAEMQKAEGQEVKGRTRRKEEKGRTGTCCRPALWANYGAVRSSERACRQFPRSRWLASPRPGSSTEPGRGIRRCDERIFSVRPPARLRAF